MQTGKSIYAEMQNVKTPQNIPLPTMNIIVFFTLFKHNNYDGARGHLILFYKAMQYLFTLWPFDWRTAALAFAASLLQWSPEAAKQGYKVTPATIPDVIGGTFLSVGLTGWGLLCLAADLGSPKWIRSRCAYRVGVRYSLTADTVT